MTHQLRTIKSQDDCSEFLGWLQEHPEIERVQGWYCVRADWNRVRQFANTPNGEFGTAHWAVVDWMYAERKVFNDWIRTILARYPCASCSCFSTCLLSTKLTKFCNYKEEAS